MLNTNRIALITGASSDLGMSYIADNIEEYKRIVCHYCHESEKWNDFLKQYGDKIIPIQADFANREEVESFLRKLGQKEIIPTHILHLASLPIKTARFHKVDFNEYAAMMQVSLYSILEILKFCIPAMQRQKYGRILFVLSAYTTIPNPRFAAPYISSKYALLGLMKTIASEYVGKGIIVNGISPQMIETKFIKELPELTVEQNKEAALLGRLLEKEDVLPIMKYLLSDRVAVIGENISIGGNYSL